MNIPELIAHRGYAARYPENTLLALSAAVEAGARYVEIDVQLSADGIPVLCHDPDLVRVAGRSEPVSGMAFADLRVTRVNEPARFGNQFDDVFMPSLAAFVDWLRQRPDVTAFVEIKEESLAAFGTAFVVTRVLDTLIHASSQCVVISFDTVALESVVARGYPAIGWIIRKWGDTALHIARRLNPAFLICNHLKIPPEDGALWPGPWQWALYEITEADVAMAWFHRGAQFIETMAVAELSAQLEQYR